ncbi:MAG TPA: YbaK/EbsC family protein [Anaerolineales bacterium]|nr:YbaK/EbsC family protein [Anaerolineales bacterium]
MAHSTPVTRALDAMGIPHKLHVHSGQVRSLEQAAEERGLDPGQIVRSLVFRSEDGSFVMVLMAGPGKVSWPRLRAHLGVSRLTTATPEEVLRVTGYEPGAVSPFGLHQPLRILADRSVLDPQEISVGAGMRNAGVVMRRSDLLAALRPEIVDVRE